MGEGGAEDPVSPFTILKPTLLGSVSRKRKRLKESSLSVPRRGKGLMIPLNGISKKIIRFGMDAWLAERKTRC